MNLNIMDDITYNQVLKPDFFSDSSLRSQTKKKKKLEKLKKALIACHLNVYVCEVVITVLGKVYTEKSKKGSQK